MAAERRVVADQQKCAFPWGSGKGYDILSFRDSERIQPEAITKDENEVRTVREKSMQF
jgi:hypothetical protein